MGELVVGHGTLANDLARAADDYNSQVFSVSHVFPTNFVVSFVYIRIDSENGLS